MFLSKDRQEINDKAAAEREAFKQANPDKYHSYGPHVSAAPPKPIRKTMRERVVKPDDGRGRDVYEARNALEMTQAAFADRFGVSHQEVSGWERGVRPVPDVHYKKIMRVWR